MDVLLDGYEKDLFFGIQRLLRRSQWSVDTNKLLSILEASKTQAFDKTTTIHQSRVPPKRLRQQFVVRILWKKHSSSHDLEALQLTEGRFCGQNRRNLDVEMISKKTFFFYRKPEKFLEIAIGLKAELCGFSNFSKRGVEEPLIDALIR